MHEFRALVDAWLEADLKAPRKQRHSAQRIYTRLREEYDFRGSSSAVRRHVRKWKQNHKRKEAFIPRQFDPGTEAQVDFGEVQIELGGVRVTIYLFCMRLAYSKGSFVCAYLRQSLEVFLDGHIRAFAFFGGVPRNLTYDNLRCAVTALDKGGRRTLTQKFLELKNYYMFDTRFCNPAKGNEKGDVENLVKWAQQNYFTPVPSFASLEELQAHLQRWNAKDLQRTVARQSEPIAKLLEEERANFLKLPTEPFKAFTEDSTFVGKELTIRCDTNRYSVPAAYVLKSVQVRRYVDRIEIYDRQGDIVSHPRSYRTNDFVYRIEHYLPLLAEKPGALQHGLPFKDSKIKSLLLSLRERMDYKYGTQAHREFGKVLLYFRTVDPACVATAIERALADGIDSVTGIYAYIVQQPVVVTPIKTMDLSARPELTGYSYQTAPAAQYDLLAQAAKGAFVA